VDCSSPALIHILLKASGPGKHPVQDAKIIAKLYTLLKIQDPENHTLSSGTYLFRPNLREGPNPPVLYLMYCDVL